MLRFALLGLLLAAATSASPHQRERVTTGTRQPPLDVVIIPHTHLDVGWLQTWESYYHLNVSLMLPGIVSNLKADKTKRFTWAEVAYFQKWWQEDATPSEQTDLRALVASKQFEFVDGGIVQHDQACPTAEGIVSQMTTGHFFLRETFNVTPRIGWSLDPFGSSAANAALYATAGFDALVINRIPDKDMNPMKASKGLQFEWKGSNSLSNTIFTHVLDSYFCPPGGFRWSWSQPDSPSITPQNAPDRAKDFAKQVLPRAAWFQTDHILVPWGCDFMYQNASRVFYFTDNLIAEINAHPDKYNMTIRYGTPAEYFASVWKTKSSGWPTRSQDDFFPLVYGSGKGVQSWSGYFSSRPSLKAQARHALSAVAASQKLAAFAGQKDASFEQKSSETLMSAAFNNAIALHHDAITGTMCVLEEGCTGGGQGAGDHRVLEDYLNLQASAVISADAVTVDALTLLTNTSRPVPVYDKDFSVQLQRRRETTIVVHNPNGQQYEGPVEINVPVNGISIFDANGKAVPTQTFLPSTGGDTHGTIGNARRGPGTSPYGKRFDQTLTFHASIPPMGLASFTLRPCTLTDTWPFNCASSSETAACSAGSSCASEKDSGTYVLSNPLFTLYATKDTGPVALYDNVSRTNFSFTAQLRSYSTQPNNMPAYIFEPQGSSAPLVAKAMDAAVQRGPVADELWVRLTEEHSISFRVYHNVPLDGDGVVGFAGLEVRVELGTIEVNTEVALQLSTSLAATQLFTDANGFQMMARSHDPNITVQENAWPVTSSVKLVSGDGSKAMGVAFAQAHAAVLETGQPGQVQFLLSRRVLSTGAVTHDDTEAHTYTFGVTLGSATQANRRAKIVGAALNSPPRPFAVLPPAKATQGQATVGLAAFAPTTSLPPNVRLLSLLQLPIQGKMQLVVRLQHTYEVGEDPQLSSSVDVDLAKLFTPESGIAVQAATPYSTLADGPLQSASSSGTVVSLAPLQLGTWVLTTGR